MPCPEVFELPATSRCRIGVPIVDCADAGTIADTARIAAGPTIEPPIWQPRVRRHRSRPLATRHRIKRQRNERIQALIRQLGHPRFTIRRSAASELRQIGAEAFDLLNAASNDSDPEVAASARYLLREITVRWVHSGDSAAVRALLRDYGQQRDELRVARLDGLAKLPNSEGVACVVPHCPFRPLAVGFSSGGVGDHSTGRAAKPTDADRPRRGEPGAGHKHAGGEHVASPIPGAASRSGRLGRIVAAISRRRDEAVRGERG